MTLEHALDWLGAVTGTIALVWNLYLAERDRRR